MYVCARGVSTLRCGELLVSELVICHPTIPRISAVLPLCARDHQCGKTGTFVIENLNANPSLHLRPQMQFF